MVRLPVIVGMGGVNPAGNLRARQVARQLVNNLITVIFEDIHDADLAQKTGIVLLATPRRIEIGFVQPNIDAARLDDFFMRNSCCEFQGQRIS